MLSKKRENSAIEILGTDSLVRGHLHSTSPPWGEGVRKMRTFDDMGVGFTK